MTEVARVGLGYRVTGKDVEFSINRLRERAGDLSGELTVTRPYPPHQDGFAPRVSLYQGRFNVSSLTSRRTLTSYLVKRDKVVDLGSHHCSPPAVTVRAGAFA